MTPLTRDVFDSATAERRLCDYFAVATTDAFGTLTRLEATAAAACVTYIERTQVGKRPPLSPPSREAAGTTMAIDPATRANLELTRTLSGERRGSLLAALDSTVTAAGSRLLAQRLAAPLTDAAVITRRLDAVSAFVADSARARETANGCCMPRRTWPARWRGCRSAAAARAIWPRSPPALPRPTRCLRGWAAMPELPQEIAIAAAALRKPPRALAEEFARALADELPLFKRDGGFVRAGYEPALDEARALRDESRRVVAAMQARYADESGVKALKIRHNNVLGYFVEVTAQHGDKLMSPPLNATFIHRQTLAGQVRFTTSELGQTEAKIANAADRALALELEIFEKLAAMAIAASDELHAAAQAFAALDVATALAKLASRPELRAARGRRVKRFRHRRRAASGGRAGAVARRPAVHRQRLRSVAARARDLRPDLDRHRSEHGR